ncbi:MAG: TetR/AcrR family transcriptional regulator [Sandaracinaceae bacterium]
MRADAERNRLRLVEVTVELVLEVGGEPTRDAIAQRAGVGIGTLYRHFPDPPSLLRAAARHVLEKSIGAGEELLETVPDGVDALRRYMHAALDNGIGAVNIIRPLLGKTEWADLRRRAGTLTKKLLAGAARASLRGDLTERDIVFALTRFARPLAMGLPAAEERALAHRHLDFYIDGLCAGHATNREPGNREPGRTFD